MGEVLHSLRKGPSEWIAQGGLLVLHHQPCARRAHREHSVPCVLKRTTRFPELVMTLVSNLACSGFKRALDQEWAGFTLNSA
jgi:hypothetical protein